MAYGDGFAAKEAPIASAAGRGAVSIVELSALPPRIARKIDTSADCWEWQGARNKDGYGRVFFNGGVEYAHRVVHLLTKGHPGDLLVLHTCDNPPCCRPSHLFLGTHLDNARDCIRKGRRAKPRCKLDHQSAGSIRELYASGDYTQRVLGRMFGVDQRTISTVVRGQRWALPAGALFAVDARSTVC